jgi:hypothetical protein
MKTRIAKARAVKVRAFLTGVSAPDHNQAGEKQRDNNITIIS